MRLEKVMLVIICLWGVLLAMAPVFGIEFYFPYIGKGTLDSAQQIERLLVLRSATFMTILYFTFKYFTNRKPLSSVSPILAWSSFMVFFGVISNLQNGVSIFDNPAESNWVVILVLMILTFVLFRINKTDTKKIFDKDW